MKLIVAIVRPEKLNDVLEALFRTTTQYDAKAPEARPEPCFKRLRGSLIRDAACTSKPSYQEIFGWMGEEVSTRNPEAQKPIILLMDGQQSLWECDSLTRNQACQRSGGWVPSQKEEIYV
mgnify:CR=1 FL=1